MLTEGIFRIPFNLKLKFLNFSLNYPAHSPDLGPTRSRVFPEVGIGASI